MRALCAELRIPELDWPKVVPSIQSVIKNSPSRRLEIRSPIEFHTGMKLWNTLSMAFANLETREDDSAEQVAILRKPKIDEMIQALYQMHKSVNEKPLRVSHSSC